MLFIERKSGNEFIYETKQFVGDFKFTSDKKLDGTLLDSLVLNLQGGSSTKGETNYKGINIKYEFYKSSVWEDDLIENK